MRPTAKDLAEAAGVSLATVDRVLNDRPNVSEKAARRVTEAIERIGFVRNPAAVNLARNRVYRFRFVLPLAGDQYMQEILRQIGEAREALRVDLTDIDVVQLPTGDPHAVAKYLSSLSTDDIDGVAIMAPESPQVRDAMARLVERGIKVVQFLSGQERLPAADFVGVNNFAAGATAGKLLGRFLGREPGKIMVVAETMMAQDSIERRLGFDGIINEHFPQLTSLPSIETYGDERRASTVIARMLEHNGDITGVYILSAEARVPMSAIEAVVDPRPLTIIVHERTPFSEKALLDERIDAVIAQNPGHAVRSAIRIMRARVEQREPIASQEKIRIEIVLKENLGL
ncbi:LacI family DNA-binding transcriptional regulator [Ciceribacter sp. L1K23]|uniref:LacI family DNA-binding transcriptional regulator n=1 Tax=unclassified Ciceribacter TaxID=2628820 RepID=UPI001ABDBED0|nr:MULTISPECIES: LacI family DNA-binding transcriptional regulator [unclassified Ciceribacter]MBO3761382.1 LacI family DNA-binding transcriptional regulator [Ciceribacter sp. L1K22]MBR0554321.1 LacI family DNA-binding transcriptional regulator [Ciceribacter sp. L1K23]